MEQKEDEDISIDFGKIKNWFKSAQPERKDDLKEEQAEKVEHKKDSETAELSIDFSKIKNFFKSSVKETAKEAAEGEEEITINWSKAANFFKKHSVFFILMIPIILSIYVRMQAGMLLFTDDWATNNVINNIKSQIRAGISRDNPNLPEANINTIVDIQFQKAVNENKQRIDEQIRQTSAYIKSFFQDEGGKNYMPDIDPYYWVRYAENIVEHGHPGDVLKEGKPFDNHQLAPLGRFVFPDMFHPYSLAYFYNILHFFMPQLTIMRSAFYLPVFVSALCVLLVFLIARKIAGNIGGFFAGMIMAVNGAFLGRTLFGHADNDIWVIFFPLLITWLFIETIEFKNILKVVIMASIAGFFTGLFAFAWGGGWWYIFDFLLATIALTFLYLTLIKLNDIKKDIKVFFSDISLRNIIIIGFTYFISSALFVTLFSRWSIFTNSFLGPLSFPSIKAPATESLWPNVLTTVAELNEGSINGIINSVGGHFLFFVSLLGLILAISRSEGMKRSDFAYAIGTAIFYGAYFLLKRAGVSISVYGLLIWIALPILIRISIVIYKKDLSYDFKLPILLALWTISTIFASIKGIRFTLLLAPAFSVAFGVALGKIYTYVSYLLTKELKIHKAVGSSILILLLMLMYANPINSAIGSARSDIPIINDAWYNALNAIKQDSKENAIITSWWDFGHHFKAIADRPVTFDGTTQVYPPAHWVGRLLMASNESEAMGILRMLDCGSSRAFNALYELNNDTHLSLRILNKIILLDKESAEKELKDRGINDEDIQKIISFTHCGPPEAYFIASEDMIGKSGVWSHFGSWNFERADIWQNARKMPQKKAVEYMMSKFNYTKERAENIHFEIQAISSDSEANTWIAPWPGYGGTDSCSKNKEGIYVCSRGFQINLSNNDVFAIGQQGIVRPKAAAFTTEDGIFKKEFNGVTLDFGMTIIPKSENELEAVLSGRELAGGMFTRMFYMQGHGLKYFKLFDHQRGLTGTNIYTYKVDWEGKNTTIIKEYADYFKKPLIEESLTEESEEDITESANLTSNITQ